jgi:hypothetical protein
MGGVAAADAQTAEAPGPRRHGGRSLVNADVVITNATSGGAASRSAGTAAVVERIKRRAFETLGEDSGYDFVPLAPESYGSLGKTALAFLSELGTMDASRIGRLHVEVDVRGERAAKFQLRVVQGQRAHVLYVHVFARASHVRRGGSG